MLLLGIDLGTSFIKVSVVDAATSKCLAQVSYPEVETRINSLNTGWAEQSPEMWWTNVQSAILKAHETRQYNPKDIGAIGIAYQMHGLVAVDKNNNELRESIIWCDSRAVDIGNKAFDVIGHEKCLNHLLNSPGNFTASKFASVKENEPSIYQKIATVMLPGDFIAMRLTGQTTTTISALSEGVFWDFKKNELSEDIFNHFEFKKQMFPKINNVFSNHGNLKANVALALKLNKNIPVTYKAGDQQNNALSLNVSDPGDFAATAGTSGVIYGVTDKLTFDKQSKINTFAHVNHSGTLNRLGVLLCINGTGIMNSWVKKYIGGNLSYKEMDSAAAKINAGSDGLTILPFGNGAERMLGNKNIGAHISQIDLNKHGSAHIYRAAQEGIAFAFRYGLEIMKSNGMNIQNIRAGKSNMFNSSVFTDAFVNTTNISLSLYNTDGSVGAAIGAGIGAGFYKNTKEAFTSFAPIETIIPNNAELYNSKYEEWKFELEKHINK